MIRFAVTTAFILIGSYWLFGNTDAVFRSSDGKWADSETQFKGRGFKVIVWNFEAYKLGCGRPHAQLVRATPQHWYNPFVWYSYISEPKWRVPYSDAHPEIGNYYPQTAAENCDGSRGSAYLESKTIDAAAARYLAQLK